MLGTFYGPPTISRSLPTMAGTTELSSTAVFCFLTYFLASPPAAYPVFPPFPPFPPFPLLYAGSHAGSVTVIKLAGQHAVQCSRPDPFYTPNFTRLDGYI